MAKTVEELKELLKKRRDVDFIEHHICEKCGGPIGYVFYRKDGDIFVAMNVGCYCVGWERLEYVTWEEFTQFCNEHAEQLKETWNLDI